MATPAEIVIQIEKAIKPESMVIPMREAMVILIAEQSKFPPQPDRMRSGTLNTWVREVGRLPVSAFLKTDGTRRKRPITGVVQKPSEKMLQKWKSATISVGLTGDGTLTGAVKNEASYSGYVQGEQRAPFHQETGWLTTDEAFLKHNDKITKRFVRQIVANIEGRG